jgi:steroid delta-isomerase-like uncharacterized protein
MASNKDVIKKMVDAINSGQLDEIDACVTEGFVIHDPVDGELDCEGFKGMLEKYRAAFPDMQMSDDDLVEAGDRVLHRWTIQGTHQGELQGLPATGKTVVVHGIAITRFEKDKAAEQFVEWDALGLMRQLGVFGEQPENIAVPD